MTIMQIILGGYGSGAAAADILRDANWDDVVLLLDGSGGGSSTITDHSTTNNTVTNVFSGVSSTNITGPYGSSMDVLSFDGTDDSLEFDVSTAMQLSGDFTIETWMRRSDASSRDCVIAYWGTSGNPRFRFEFDRVTDNVTFYDGTNNRDFSYSGTNADVNDTWFHLAVTRRIADGIATYEVFVDGTSLGTKTGATTTFTGNTSESNKGRIGALTDAGLDAVSGQMADFRITNGYARYVGDFDDLDVIQNPTAWAKQKRNIDYSWWSRSADQSEVGSGGDLPGSIAPVAFNPTGTQVYCFSGGNAYTVDLTTAFDVTTLTGISSLQAETFPHTNTTNLKNRAVCVSNDGYFMVGVRESGHVTFVETDTAWDFTTNANTTKSSLVALPTNASRDIIRSAGLSPDGTKLYVTDDTNTPWLYEYEIDLANNSFGAETGSMALTGMNQSNLDANIAVGPDHVMAAGNAEYAYIERENGSINGKGFSLITNDPHETAHNDSIIYSNDGKYLWFYETTGDKWYRYVTSV